MSHCSLFLSVLFLERSNSNDSEEPGEAMVNDLPVDPESELELKKQMVVGCCQIEAILSNLETSFYIRK